MGTRKLDGLTFQSLRPGAETGAPLLQKKREEAPTGAGLVSETVPVDETV